MVAKKSGVPDYAVIDDGEQGEGVLEIEFFDPSSKHGSRDDIILQKESFTTGNALKEIQKGRFVCSTHRAKGQVRAIFKFESPKVRMEGVQWMLLSAGGLAVPPCGASREPTAPERSPGGRLVFDIARRARQL